MHDVLDAQQQSPPQTATGMRECELLGGEAAGFQQCHGQRIPHHQCSGRGGRRCQVQRTGLLGDAGVQVCVCITRERRAGLAGHRDQRRPHALEQWQQGGDFGGFTGIGQCQHRVRRGDHAEIPMAGFAGMHEERRRAGAGQSRRDLAGDMAGFPHAGDDHPALGRHHQLAGTIELCIQLVLQCRDGGALDREGASGAGAEIRLHGGVIAAAGGRIIGSGRHVGGGGLDSGGLGHVQIVACVWPGLKVRERGVTHALQRLGRDADTGRMA